MSKKQNHSFPDGFLWGAATSSHQIEGGNTNNWSQWEEAGKVRNNELSGLAADHWNRWKKDFAQLKKLNLNSYRFSIEWSRIEPEPGVFNAEALEVYRQMLLELRKLNIEPIVTLHHFTDPLWLGDWNDRKNIEYFRRYTHHVVREFKDLVTYWCTINEPVVLSVMAYQLGLWPPGKQSIISNYRAQNTMIAAHKAAYDTIHTLYHDDETMPLVSMAFNLHYFAGRNNWLDSIVARIAREVSYYALNRSKHHLDYIGVNHYFTHLVSTFAPQTYSSVVGTGTNLTKNDLDWDVYPPALAGVLKTLKKYKLPIVISENGIPDDTDARRPQFIHDSLAAVHEAIAEGVDVRGYMHWSLLDNFEWHEGYRGRFGLIRVDYESQKRTVLPSAEYYATVAANNELLTLPKKLQNPFEERA